jgi:CheY-like chemotaxis protein
MAPGVRPRVLVIDDEPNVRVFISDLLKEQATRPMKLTTGCKASRCSRNVRMTLSSRTF